MQNNDRIRATWAQAILHREVLASRFYTLLFQHAPQTRSLFKGDMAAQGTKLVDTLNFIVDHLEDSDALLPAARDLAIRHVSYGVAPEHYDIVGACLLDTLSSILGADFDEDARSHWATTYDGLVGYMRKEAYSD